MTTDVYITSIASYIPAHGITTAEAVAAGCYDSDRAKTDAFVGVRVEDTLSQPQMAVKAARPLVVNDLGEGVDSIFVCRIHRHGHKLFWPVTAFVQNELNLPTSVRTVGIVEGCNGTFVAASLAYDLIQAGVIGDHIVIGADKFDGSAFDRFNSDLGTLYGDAAVAVRLSHIKGPFRVVCCALESEPSLEAMYRAETTATESPEDHNVRAAKDAYLQRHGRTHLKTLFAAALDRLRETLLDEVDLATELARYVIYPNVGAGVSASFYENAFGDLAEEDLWSFGRAIGHTGTADQFLGFAHLVQSSKLRRGDRILLIGAGNGLSLAAILIEVCDGLDPFTGLPLGITQTIPGMPQILNHERDLQ